MLDLESPYQNFFFFNSRTGKLQEDRRGRPKTQGADPLKMQYLC